MQTENYLLPDVYSTIVSIRKRAEKERVLSEAFSSPCCHSVQHNWTYSSAPQSARAVEGTIAWLSPTLCVRENVQPPGNGCPRTEMRHARAVRQSVVRPARECGQRDGRRRRCRPDASHEASAHGQWQRQERRRAAHQAFVVRGLLEEGGEERKR